MKSERGAVKGYGSWEVIVAPGPLEHRCRHLVGTKGSSSACGNNRELCKENHIETGAVTTTAKNAFYIVMTKKGPLAIGTS